MAVPLRISEAERRLLPEGRLTGPVPWMLAAMIFLTVLAAAGGLALRRASDGLGGALANRVTVQVVDANPEARERQARALEGELRSMAGVASVRRVPDAELASLLEPWLGGGSLGADLPLPAMLDVELRADGGPAPDALGRAVRDVAPGARVDNSAGWLGSLARLVGSVQWLALALVALTIGATAAAVVLAARGSLDTHRPTIEVMHLMGATDLQVARLFQRRIALDALFGGVVGTALAFGAIRILGTRASAVGSDLLGSAGLAAVDWLILLALPVLGILLAMGVARVTVLRALRRTL